MKSEFNVDQQFSKILFLIKAGQSKFACCDIRVSFISSEIIIEYFD